MTQNFHAVYKVFYFPKSLKKKKKSKTKKYSMAERDRNMEKFALTSIAPSTSNKNMSITLSFFL